MAKEIEAISEESSRTFGVMVNSTITGFVCVADLRAVLKGVEAASVVHFDNGSATLTNLGGKAQNFPVDEDN